MIENLAKNLVRLKQEFVKTYSGTSHIQEVIPISKSELFPISEDHLKLLHLFATKNPIYYNSYEQNIGNVPCIVYEGDINKYWLNSIQQSSSHAPFSPTWIFSAYVGALLVKELGFSEVLDIGSGDGRIAYCAKILGLKSFAIEIDPILVDLQRFIATETGISFEANCEDATLFDYSSLGLSKPSFFIGGLSQMGGNALTSSVIEKIHSFPNLKENTCLVLAGTYSKKYSQDSSYGGWKDIIENHGLHELATIVLPTIWTLKESDDTPYIFVEFNN